MSTQPATISSLFGRAAAPARAGLTNKPSAEECNILVWPGTQPLREGAHTAPDGRLDTEAGATSRDHASRTNQTLLSRTAQWESQRRHLGALYRRHFPMSGAAGETRRPPLIGPETPRTPAQAGTTSNCRGLTVGSMQFLHRGHRARVRRAFNALARRLAASLGTRNRHRSETDSVPNS